MRHTQRRWIEGSNGVDTSRILKEFILCSYLSMRKTPGNVSKDKFNENKRLFEKGNTCDSHIGVWIFQHDYQLNSSCTEYGQLWTRQLEDFKEL